MALAITFGALFAVAVWEFCLPRRQFEFPAFRRRLGNLGIWLFNVIAAALIFLPPDRLRAPWPLPPVLGFVVGFQILDFWSYVTHRAQHALPWLWRLHALHHSDPDVDWTTSVRHHPAEALLASAAYWVMVLALGVPGPIVGVHAATVFALAAATHGNVRWPAWLEQLLQPVVITLDLHLVHHSQDWREANANFGAVLSLWDRLFGTLANRPIDRLTYGVAELSRVDACRPSEMVLTPWRLSVPNVTHRLPDGREIEASSQVAGGRLRLRARLVEGGLVEEVLRRDYPYDRNTAVQVIEDFAVEFEALIGAPVPRPFLLQALRNAA
jgi:Fatty acid hydroxylase superfamily